MNWLVGCEFSGSVRRELRALGHDAWSCDLLPAADASPFHIQGDVFAAAASRQWDGAIFHPPCTFLSSSGLHWNKRGRMEQGRPRAEWTLEAIEFARRLMALPIPRIAMENPIGCLSTKLRKPNQIIHPHQFGSDASKATCLWLKNLPLLVPTEHVPPRIVDGKKRWANQTDSGQNRLGPSADRWALRSETYPGIARAIASQWAGAAEPPSDREKLKALL